MLYPNLIPIELVMECFPTRHNTMISRILQGMFEQVSYSPYCGLSSQKACLGRFFTSLFELAYNCKSCIWQCLLALLPFKFLKSVAIEIGNKFVDFFNKSSDLLCVFTIISLNPQFMPSYALIGQSLGLETKSTETLGLVPVSYKILEVVSSRMKIFQTVSVSSCLLQFYSVLSQSQSLSSLKDGSCLGLIEKHTKNLGLA